MILAALRGGGGVEFLGVDDGEGVVGGGSSSAEEQADGGRGGGEGRSAGDDAGVVVGDGYDGEGVDFDVLGGGGGVYFHG